MSEIGRLLIEGLDEFVEKLRRDEPIEVTEVRRVETPDGPMHLRRKVILGRKEGSDGESTERDPAPIE